MENFRKSLSLSRYHFTILKFLWSFKETSGIQDIDDKQAVKAFGF